MVEQPEPKAAEVSEVQAATIALWALFWLTVGCVFYVPLVDCHSWPSNVFSHAPFWLFTPAKFDPWQLILFLPTLAGGYYFFRKRAFIWDWLKKWPDSRHVKLTLAAFVVVIGLAYGIGRDWYFMHDAQITFGPQAAKAPTQANIQPKQGPREGNPAQYIDQNLIDEQEQINRGYLGLNKWWGDDPVSNFIANVFELWVRAWNELHLDFGWVRIALIFLVCFTVACIVAALVDELMPSKSKPATERA